jgi:DNA-binding transcriptional LysR family regulator
MKIEVFATLDAVLRTGSFAGAAAETNLTPSAVSMQMKQLEQYLGQALFDRSGLQVQPRPAARELSAAVAGGMAHVQALRRRTPLAVEGVVRLGVIESMQPVLLPGTLRALRDRYPGLEVRPLRGRSAGLTDMVKAGTLDAAVVAQPEKGGQSGVRWHALEERELVLIAPPASPTLPIDAMFERYEWIRYERDTVSGAMAARWVNAHVPQRRPWLEFDSVPAIVAMVHAGLGISIVQLADLGICLAYPVRIVRLGADAPRLRVSLVMRKADEDDRRLIALRAAMESTLKGRGAS